MTFDKSGFGDEDDNFGLGSTDRMPSPLGGGGTTNIGGGTSGAPMGNTDAGANPSSPISDVIDTDLADDVGVGGGVTDQDNPDNIKGA